MERKGATYLVMEATDKDLWKLIYYILKYIEIPEIDCLSYIVYIQTHPVITQFLQPEAEQLLLFRILLASIVLTSSFVKRSATCSWQLQVAIKQEVSIRNRDFKM